MLSPHPDGVVVEVWVIPGAWRDAVGGVHDRALRVHTTAPAEGGRANRAVAGLVAARLGARRAEVITGHASRRKRVLVTGVGLAAAEAALADGTESG
jgi:uncharacterized protein (TIGR00251 family)